MQSEAPPLAAPTAATYFSVAGRLDVTFSRNLTPFAGSHPAWTCVPADGRIYQGSQVEYGVPPGDKSQCLMQLIGTPSAPGTCAFRNVLGTMLDDLGRPVPDFTGFPMVTV